MKPFFYLNYYIYRFYEGRDPDPFVYSLNGSSLLVLLNFMSIYYGISYFILGQELKLNYVLVLILLALIAANYLLIYRGKKYEKIFQELREKDTPKKQILCLVYIIASFCACLGVVLLMKFQKYGTL